MKYANTITHQDNDLESFRDIVKRLRSEFKDFL